MKHLQNCTEPPLPPDATGIKSEFAAQCAVVHILLIVDHFSCIEKKRDIPRQDQSIVVLELQYAALAKKVKGLNEEISSELRRVTSLCFLND